MNEVSAIVDVTPGELGTSLRRVRLCAPQDARQMELSLSKLGQLTPLQGYRVEPTCPIELFDGLKRLRAAQALSWTKLRVEVHALEGAAAKVRLLLCNGTASLSDIEVAWVVRALYREDKLDQPHIAQLLQHDKSWVCRKLMLAEGLSDELTSHVRLGLVAASTAVELARLQRCNQDTVAQVVIQRGLTTRQTGRLVETLLATAEDQWPAVLAQAGATRTEPEPKGGARRRTPGEQVIADALAMKSLAARLHARLLERSLQSLGEPACAVAARELTQVRDALCALATTLERRLMPPGAGDVAA